MDRTAALPDDLELSTLYPPVPEFLWRILYAGGWRWHEESSRSFRVSSVMDVESWVLSSQYSIAFCIKSLTRIENFTVYTVLNIPVLRYWWSLANYQSWFLNPITCRLFYSWKMRGGQILPPLLNLLEMCFFLGFDETTFKQYMIVGPMLKETVRRSELRILSPFEKNPQFF